MDLRGRLGVCLSEMITNIVLGGVATQAMDSVSTGAQSLLTIR